MTEFAINSSGTVAKPRPAATVLPLREIDGRVEVLMTLRHAGMAFMGGTWVFPGGSLAATDREATARGLVAADAAGQCAILTDLDGTSLPAEECLALSVAACRETFEEIGVLIARRADGSSCTPSQIEAVRQRRAEVAEHSERFAPVLAEHNLVLDVGKLVYWAHWITPSSGPRRFDTRFFVVPVPPEQTAAIDATEAVEHRWMTPAALVDAARRREMPIPQPTLYNLDDLDAALQRHGSLGAFLRGEARREVLPVMPKMFRDGDRTVIVMPWDDAYATTEGEGVPASVRYPAEVRARASRLQFERKPDAGSR